VKPRYANGRAKARKLISRRERRDAEKEIRNNGMVEGRTEWMPDSGCWILEPGCWTPTEKTNKRAEEIFSRRAAVNAEGKIRDIGMVEGWKNRRPEPRGRGASEVSGQSCRVSGFDNSTLNSGYWMTTKT